MHWVKALQDRVKSFTAEKIFGGFLKYAVSKSEHAVPQVVFDSVEHMKKLGLKAEGIFRVPGNNDDIMGLCNLYEKATNGIESWEPDIHTTAGLLKVVRRYTPAAVSALPVHFHL